MNGQAVSPTVLKAYRVEAAARFEGSDVPKHVSFVLSAEGGKQAWVAARFLTRVGGEVKPVEGGTVTRLAAGTYTVQAVKAVERTAAPKVQVLTVDSLLAAAEAESIPVGKKLLELIGRLKQQPSAPAAAPVEPKAEAAA